MAKAESYQALQKALDRYIESRKAQIPNLLEARLHLKECFEIQKKYFLKDLIRNPINAFWAIPALSIRKGLEVAEKLGWEPAKTFLSKVPQSFKTDFQKEVERILARDLFGLSDEHRISSEFSLELAKESALLSAYGRGWDEMIALAEKEIRAEIQEQSVKHSNFTDLVASAGVILVADQTFGDKSLDIFGLGRKIASLWARRDAEQSFFLGKSLGKAFYSVAPAPPPTTSQIFLATAMAVLSLAFISTLISLLSYPVQKKLGFRQKQLEKMVDQAGDRLLLKLSKNLKEIQSAS